MPKKDLTVYCNNSACPASAMCKRYTRRANDEMPANTTVMKFETVPGGVHCGSYIHKPGSPTVASYLLRDSAEGKERAKKLTMWLRKCRGSLKVARRVINDNKGRLVDFHHRNDMQSALDEIDRSIHTTGGTTILPDSFDILKYLQAKGRRI